MRRNRTTWFIAALLAAFSLIPGVITAQTLTATPNAGAYPIDLPTVLRLARAQNLDVQLARTRMDEARAQYRGSLSKFFPWISPGAAVQRHEGRTQAVDGTLLDVEKQNVVIGATLSAQLDIGESLFASLAARQAATASNERLQASEQDSATLAAKAYFDLLKAKLLVNVSRAALQTSQEYGRQLQAAVAAGVAFKGDALRVQTQSERYRVEISQALERQHVAGTQLAHLLHLDPTIELTPQDPEVVPLTLVPTEALDPLIQQALAARPELKESRALVAAAQSAKHSAVYGPLIPALSAQAFAGELGGGSGTSTGNRGDSEDYYVGLRWRFGPGGLLDFGRIDASRARLRAAEINQMKVHDTIVREVVDGYTRVQALSEQIAASRQTLAIAAQTLDLTRERKQLGVGVVLEDIQAQQELNRARAEHLSLIAEFNKTQYELGRSLGRQ